MSKNKTIKDSPVSAKQEITIEIPKTFKVKKVKHPEGRWKGIQSKHKDSVSPFCTDIFRAEKINRKFKRKASRAWNKAMDEWEENGEKGPEPKQAPTPNMSEVYRTAVNLGLDVMERMLEEDIPFPQEPSYEPLIVAKV